MVITELVKEEEIVMEEIALNTEGIFERISQQLIEDERKA